MDLHRRHGFDNLYRGLLDPKRVGGLRRRPEEIVLASKTTHHEKDDDAVYDVHFQTKAAAVVSVSLTVR